MKILTIMKDGGNLSRVWGLFLVEFKTLFSVVFLWFASGSREAFHTHAFNAVSWVIWGKLIEDNLYGRQVVYRPSFKPIWTPRDRFHKVTSEGTTIAISFRGPWLKHWREYLPVDKKFLVLTHGRKVIA
jgi:hypothetical protein